eukprot:jgi/Mesen1/7808/ME000413S07061
MTQKTITSMFQIPKRVEVGSAILDGCQASSSTNASERPSKKAKVVKDAHDFPQGGGDTTASAVLHEEASAGEHHRSEEGTPPSASEARAAAAEVAAAVEGSGDGGGTATGPGDREGMATGAAGSPMSEQQRARMEMNRSAALTRRALKACADRVAEAQAQGQSFPKLAELLAEPSWQEALGGEFRKPYWLKLCQFVRQEAAASAPVYPPPGAVFHAFHTCPLESVRVVILGQDPYHGAGQAMGLAFSVPAGVRTPSSLANIYKELRDDLGCSIPPHGTLDSWCCQGVLLLNTCLTVRAHQATSHSRKGWEVFTDAAIRAVSQARTGVVFLLWGNHAQEKRRLIDEKKHHVLKCAHPSGLSASRGFFGCRHFSKANALLQQGGMQPIDWQIR